MKLGTRKYRVERSYECWRMAIIQCELILTVKDNEDMPEALANIEKYLSNDITFVKAQDRPRCFYCASLNEIDANKCEQCGASL